MYLTEEEFKRIRGPFDYTIREINGVVYKTLTNIESIHLFWLDFLKYIFAPKYKRQDAIIDIPSFDLSYPVLITKDQNLLLPPILETAMHFSNNRNSQSPFILNHCRILVVFIISIFILIGLLSVSIISSNKRLKKNEILNFINKNMSFI